LQWSNFPIDVESDCLEAVKMIKGGGENKSKYVFIVREIITALGERNSCITHTRRTCNNVSHALANIGRMHHRTMVWLESGSVEVLKLIEQECNTLF
jgi:hypothetical protein